MRKEIAYAERWADPHDFGNQHEPDWICVHAVAEYLEDGDSDIYCIDYLEQKDLMPHAFISTSGLTIRTLPPQIVGAHVRGMNTGALGVELMVAGCHTYESFIQTLETYVWPTDQINALCRLISDWRTIFGIPIRKVFGHCHKDPVRKVDPGKSFPWKDVLQSCITVPESIHSHDISVEGHLNRLKKSDAEIGV